MNDVTINPQTDTLRLDAMNVLNEISNRARMETYGTHEGNILREQYDEAMLIKGRIEAYAMVVAGKYQRELNEKASLESMHKNVAAYIEHNWEEYQCESKTIEATKLFYVIIDNICPKEEVVHCELLKFCMKKNITIKW